MDAIKITSIRPRPSLTVAGFWLRLAHQFCSVFCGRHCSIRLRVGAHRDCDRRRFSRAPEGPQSHRSSCGAGFAPGQWQSGRPRNRDRDDALSHWPRTDGGQARPSGRQRRSAFDGGDHHSTLPDLWFTGNAAKCSRLRRQRPDSAHAPMQRPLSHHRGPRNTTTTQVPERSRCRTVAVQCPADGTASCCLSKI